jgi:small nuclear ribonucleoprotein E
MTGRGGGGGGRKVLVPPINFIFKLLQQHSTVQIWLYEQLGIRIEGKLRGFDEFMNLVVDEAVEVKQPTKDEPEPENPRRKLGRSSIPWSSGGQNANDLSRADIAEGRQRVLDSGTGLRADTARTQAKHVFECAVAAGC